MSKMPYLQSELTTRTTPSHGCWLWTGQTVGAGYGSVRGIPKLQHLTQYAHRAAWLLFCGDIPTGVRISQTCGNRRCVNPAHLEPLAPRSQRLATPTKVWRGERNPKAKLTAVDVMAIQRALRGGARQDDVAKNWAISRSLVSAIGARRRWRHLP